MRYSLLAALSITPTFGGRLDYQLLVGMGFLLALFALMAAAIVLDGIFKARLARDEERARQRSSQRRRGGRRRSTFRKHQPLHLVKSESKQAATSPALNALRRNAEASMTRQDDAPPTSRPDIYLVKRKARA